MAAKIHLPNHIELKTYKYLADQIEAVERDGFVYLPHHIDSAAVIELRECMDRLEPRPECYDWNGTPENGGFTNKAINNAFARDPVLWPYLDRAGVIEIAEGVHGDDCHIIQMTAWITGPGRPDQKLHTDWQPITLPEDAMARPDIRIPVFITTAHFYLDDIDEAIGPTQFIPGSHRSGHAPDGATSWNGVQPQNLMCKAGDVVIFRSEVWHRGTANTSDRTRYLLQVHYANRWIAQRFTPYLSSGFDEKLLAKATPRQRRLLGEHKSGAYA